MNDIEGIHGGVGVAQGGRIAVEPGAAPTDQREDDRQAEVGIHEGEDHESRHAGQPARQGAELDAAEKDQQDGGDIEFVSFESGVVKVRLKGACCGCPMSQMTLSNFVEAKLKEAVPEIKQDDPVL